MSVAYHLETNNRGSLFLSMATVVYCDAGGQLARIKLGEESVLIGRTEQCEIRTSDNFVAPTHARISLRNKSWWIEDLSGSSTILIDGQRVRESLIPLGEFVAVGSLVLRVEADDAGTPAAPAKQTSIDPQALAQILDLGLQRQHQLEEERNALGQRLGQLHQELAQTRQALEVEETEPGITNQANEQANGHSENLDEIVNALRVAEKARDAVAAKIRTTERKRANTQSELAKVQKNAQDAGPAELEIRQVQALALNAQAAQAGESTKRLRGQLVAREHEIAQLRARAKRESGPRMTRSYGTVQPPLDDSDSDVLNLKIDSNLETLREQLKVANERTQFLAKAATQKDQALKKIVSELAAATKKLEHKKTGGSSLEQQLVKLKAENKRLAKGLTKDSQERPTLTPGEVAPNLEEAHAKLEDLQKLLESARRDARAAREKLHAQEQRGEEQARQITEFEKVVAANKQAERASSARVETLEKELAAAQSGDEKRDLQLVELEHLQLELEVLRQKLTEQEGATQQAIESSNAQTAKIEKLEEERNSLKETIEKNTESQAKARTERRGLEALQVRSHSQAKELRAKLELSERRLEETTKLRIEAEAAANAANAEAEKARVAREASERELEQITNARTQDNTQIRTLREQFNLGEKESGLHIERLEKRLREVETDLDRALDAEQAALAKSDAECVALTAAREQIESKLAQETKKNSDLIAQLKDSERQARETAARIDELEIEIAAIQTKKDATEESRGQAAVAITDELNKAKAQLEIREREFAAIQAELDETRLELERGHQELELAKRETEEAKLKASQTTSALEEARRESHQANAQLEQAHRDLAEQKQQIESVAKERDTATSELDTATSELDTATSELAALRNKSDNESDKEYAKLREQMVELASQNAQQSSEISALREQLDERTDALNEACAEVESLRARLESSESHNLDLSSTNNELTRRYDLAALEFAADPERTMIQTDKSLEKLEREIEALTSERQTLRDRITELEIQWEEQETAGEATEQIRLDTFLENKDENKKEGNQNGAHATLAAGPALVASEWLETLHGAIGELRKQMRTASDEAAFMEGDAKSLDIVNESLSAAIVRVETARESISQIAAALGVTL